MSGAGPPPEQLVGCAVCGITAPASESVLWMREAEPRPGRAGAARGGRWVCPGCARTYLRSIEAKLPEEYW